MIEKTEERCGHRAIKSLFDEFAKQAEDFVVFGPALSTVGSTSLFEELTLKAWVHFLPHVHQRRLAEEGGVPDVLPELLRVGKTLSERLTSRGHKEETMSVLRLLSHAEHHRLEEFKKLWREEVEPSIRLLTGLSSTALSAPRSTPQGNEHDLSHSEDFDAVSWRGEQFEFSPLQASCVKLLWGEPPMYFKVILERIDSHSRSLRDVFKLRKGMHPAWKTFVVSHRRGYWGLEGVPIKNPG